MPSLSQTNHHDLSPLSVETIPIPFQPLRTGVSTSLQAGYRVPKGLVFQLTLTDRVAIGRQLIAEDIETFGPIPAGLRDEARRAWPD